MRLNKREQEFVALYKDRHDVDLVPQPAAFRFYVDGNRISYSPDFYCPKTLTFLELAGTRQAANFNRDKYEAFMKAYPQLKFDVVASDGSSYVFHKKHQKLVKPVIELSIPDFCSVVAKAMREYVAEANLDSAKLANIFNYPNFRAMIRDTTVVPTIEHARRLHKFLPSSMRKIIREPKDLACVAKKSDV